MATSVTRRQFLKGSGATLAGGLTLSALGLDTKPAMAHVGDMDRMKKLREATQTTSICCYCSVGCGLICSTDKSGTVINIEGDPDHPVSEGTLCPKGANIMETTAANQHRLRDVLYRAPNSDTWEKKDWTWAVDKIARNIKKDRDAGFIRQNSQGQTVNRVDTIAFHGSSNVNSEECFMMVSMARALGMVYIDHQARV